MKIYVATSWKNPHQPHVVEWLRECGHTVYDFRNPPPPSRPFQWIEIDPQWEHWRVEKYIEALKHPIAEQAFNADYRQLQQCDICVLVMPAGRSAHMEAGFMGGQYKPLIIVYESLNTKIQPELLHLMANEICDLATIDKVVEKYKGGIQ